MHLVRTSVPFVAVYGIGFHVFSVFQTVALPPNYDDPYPILAVVERDWISQFAVSFVADISPKTSRAGTTGRWRRSGLLGQAGSNRSSQDAGCRDHTTMRRGPSGGRRGP